MDRKMKRLAMSLLLLLFPVMAFAQTAFEDAGGNSSILIKDTGGFAKVNVSDASVRVGYLFDLSNRSTYYGFEVSGKLAGDFASIFHSNQPAPGARFRASIGRRWIFSEKPSGDPTKGRLTDDWLTFQVGYARSRFKVLSEDSNFANQIRTQNFDGYSMTVAYNALFKNTRGPLLFGTSLGVERKSNIDDLDEVEVVDEVFADSSGTTRRSVVSRQQAFRGTYKETTAIPVYTDLVWFPRQFESRIGINFFTRSNIGQVTKRFEPGVGLFFTLPGAPTRVIGGISVSVRDGKAAVGLVAGFNF